MSRDPKFRSFTWIGEVEPDILSDLVDFVSGGELSLEFDSRLDARFYLPAWLFEYPLWVYEGRDEAVARLAAGLRSVPGEDLSPNLPALHLVLGDAVPERYAGKRPWFLPLANDLRAACRPRPCRPRIYLTILRHFLQMISADELDSTYSPEQVRELLLLKPGASTVPLGLVDPLMVLNHLVDTLTRLWEGRNDRTVAFLRGCRAFRLNAQGTLLAKTPLERHWQTILTHCRSCKKQPLILGIDVVCSACHGLRCHFESRGGRCDACKCPRNRSGPGKLDDVDLV